MGIKTKVFTSLVLGAASVAAIITSPALANNNDRYLNELAMQMYFQNQQRSLNPYLYNNFGSPYANYGYNYTGQPPWSAGATPYGYGNIYGRGYLPHGYYHHNWWR